MKLVILVNKSWNLIQFRKDLIFFLKNNNFNISLVCEDKNNELNEFKKVGCDIYFIGNGFFSNVINLFKILSDIKPNFVLNFTLKSIFTFTLTNFILRIRSVSTFSGLGYLYLNNKYIYYLTILFVFLFSFRKKTVFLFHNIEDLKLFNNYRIIKKINLIHMPGSGINCNFYKSSQFLLNAEHTNFIMISRLIKEKGVIEFCKAAKEITKINQNMKFTLIVKTDLKNKGALHFQNIRPYIDAAGIEYIENVSDIRNFIDKSDCVVLPSYREGLSRFLLEGMSMSKPILTTNVPGCKDLVNQNGFLFEPRDYIDLKEKLIKFHSLSRVEMKKMGEKSRDIILKKYNVEQINRQYLNIINNF